MYVIKNVRDHVVHVQGVAINPGQQLTIQTISGEVNAALDRGDLHLANGDPTPEERHADVKALKPFRVGDLAIDGK